LQSSLKTTADSWQLEQQIQQGVWGCTHTAHIAQQRLYANCLQMIEEEQWPTSSSDLNPGM